MTKDTSDPSVASNSKDVGDAENQSTSKKDRVFRLDVASAYKDNDTEAGRRIKFKKPSLGSIQLFIFFAFFIIIQVGSGGTANTKAMVAPVFIFMLVVFISNIIRKNVQRKTDK